MKTLDTSLIDGLIWTAYTAKLSNDRQQVEAANTQIVAAYHRHEITEYQRDACFKVLLQTADSTRYNYPLSAFR